MFLFQKPGVNILKSLGANRRVATQFYARLPPGHIVYYNNLRNILLTFFYNHHFRKTAPVLFL